MRRRARSVLVGNIGTLQGGLPLIPDAKPDDGVLDVAILAPRTVPDWLRLGVQLIRRQPSSSSTLLECHRAKQISIRVNRRQPRELDGEVIEPGTGIDITVDPRAVLVRVTSEALAAANDAAEDTGGETAATEAGAAEDAAETAATEAGAAEDAATETAAEDAAAAGAA